MNPHQRLTGRIVSKNTERAAKETIEAEQRARREKNQAAERAAPVTAGSQGPRNQVDLTLALSGWHADRYHIHALPPSPASSSACPELFLNFGPSPILQSKDREIIFFSTIAIHGIEEGADCDVRQAVQHA
ncbi:hypothetical protein ACOJBO_31550 [Rhizobium beringeri]